MPFNFNGNIKQRKSGFDEGFTSPINELFSVSFITKNVGSYSTLNADTGFSLSRASIATVQTSDTTFVTGIAINTARIGQRTATDASRGLVIEETRTNLLSFARQTTGTGWSAGIGTATQNYADGPDGQTLADRNNNDTIGDYGNYDVNASWTDWQAASCWLRDVSGSGVYCASFGRDATANIDAIASSGTGSLNWQKIELVVSSSIQKTFVPVDSRGTQATPGGAVARVQDNITDGHQVEMGRFATEFIYTTGSQQARSGERLFHGTASALLSSGRLSLELNIIPKGASGSYSNNMYLWKIDNNNFASISATTRRLDITVGGTTHTFSTALQWQQFDSLDIYTTAGNGASGASYRVNGGVAINLGTSTGTSGSLIGTGSLDLLCNGTTNQFSCWLKTIKAYGTVGVPSWVS